MKFSVFALSVLLCLLNAGCGDPFSVRQKCFTNGNKFYERGKYKEASLMYRRALQLDAKFADAWYRLGLTNIKLGNGRAAIAALRRATELDPNNDDGFMRLGDLYARAALVAPDDHDRQTVVKLLEPVVTRLAQKNSSPYDTYRLEGQLAILKRNRKLAIEKFRAANNLKSWQPEVALALAENLAVDGHGEEARQTAEELLARHRDYVPAYIFLYDFFVRNMQFDRAEDILKRRIQNVPDEGGGRIQLALTYYITGRKDEMLAVLKNLRGDRGKLPGVDGLIGEFYGLIGDYDNSVASFRDAAKFNPKEKIHYELRAIETLLAYRKNSEALDATERLYKANSRNAPVAAFRAMLRAQLDPRELQNSIHSLELLAKQNSQDPLIHYFLGRAYRQKGDSSSLTKARTHLETVAAMRPNFIPAKALLAQVRLMQHDGQGVIQTTDDVLRRDQGNLNARLSRAMAFSMLEEPDKARQDLLVALALHKKSTEPRLRLAGMDLAQRKYKEAGKGFDLVAKAGDPRGVVGIAQAQAAQGHVAQAVMVLQKHCTKYPDLSDCVSTLSALEFQLGHYDEAKRGFEKMSQLEPNAAEPFVRIAESQTKMGDAAGALASFRKARQLDPTEVRAILGTGVLLDAMGQKTQAVEAYEEVLRLDSGNAQASNNLAYIKAEQGADLDRALALAQSAVQRSPEDISYLDTLGLVYYKRGMIKESIDVLQPLVKKYPSSPSIHLHLALALFANARRELSAKELQLAMKYSPTASEQTQIRDLAGKLHLE